MNKRINQSFNESFEKMAQVLKEDSLPIVFWGNVSEELYKSSFEKESLKVDAICDINEGLKQRGGGISFAF